MVRKLMGIWQQSGQTRGLGVPAQGTYAGLRLYRNLHVLLIGVSNFRHIKSPLPGAANDVRALKQVLVNDYGVPEENVIILLDAAATKQAIENALVDLTDTNRVSKDDAVLVFIATHGVTLDDRDGYAQFFIVPYDARISPENKKPNPADFNRYCVALSRNMPFVRTCPARQIVLIVDTCFSGALGQTRDLGTPLSDPERLRRLAMEPAVQVLTAGTARQVVFESGSWGQHGALAKAIVDVLRSHAERNPGAGLSLSDIWREAVGRIPGNLPQDPRLYSWSGDGEFVLVAKAGEGTRSSTEPRTERNAPNNLSLHTTKIPPAAPLLGIAFSSDSQYLASQDGLGIWIYHVADEKLVRIPIEGGVVGCITFTPSGRELLTFVYGVEPTIHVLRAFDGQSVRTISLQGDQLGIESKFSKDTQHLAVGEYLNNSVFLYRTTDGRLVRNQWC